MEVESGCWKLRPSPYLVYIGGKDGEKMAFCSISQIGDPKYVIKTKPLALRGKQIRASCYDWLILLDKQNNQYSLWNPLTLDFICLPALVLKPEQVISSRILSSPPGNHDSMLILFEKNVPSFIFCRIGDEKWTHQPITENFKHDEGDFLTNFVVCNSRLYCNTFRLGKLVEIDLSMQDNHHLALVLLDVSRPKLLESYCSFTSYMLESCGELFTIYLFIVGPNGKRVVAVEVFKLDFSSMEWKKVESLKDQAFFVGGVNSSFSCPATRSGVKANHLYFTSYKDRSLYSFNMEDKIVSVSLPCSNLSISSGAPIWVMPNSRNVNRESKDDIDDRGEEIKCENRQVVVKPAPATDEEAAGGDLSKLPLDMVFEIGRCLILGDYMSFRAVNKTLRLAAPPIRWKDADLEGFEDYNHLPPWLTFLKPGDAICNFIDPFRGEKYFVNIPNKQSKATKMCYSRDGWCVILQGERSMFLWNPLSEKIIPLPDLRPNLVPGWNSVIGCSFSSSRDWFVLIRNDFQFDFIFLKEGRWRFFFTFGLGGIMTWVSNPTFYDGSFYFVCAKSRLAAFKYDEEKVIFKTLKMPKTPRFYEAYLLECDGKLLLVLVGFLGEWIRVFKLDLVEMIGVEVENLGKNTLYVSRFSCFSMVPTRPGMENKIYFSRFYKEKNVVYYSLSTGKLHAHGTEEVLENFYNTKEQLLSTWIEPKWF